MILLKDFTPRLYQQTIFANALKHNTLVVLPTGLGKTAIGMMLAVKRLSDFPKSKVVFLAPTKPLVEQHLRTFKKHIDFNEELSEEQLVVFTGTINPEKRALLWEKSRIVFSTPQGFENDILSGRINIEDVSLIIFDEAHRAVGNYSYVLIAKEYVKRARFPRILALTASPGSDVERIKEVCDNLFIENIEVRTENDFDVKPYVKKIIIDWVMVKLPKEFDEIRNHLKKSYEDKIKQAAELTSINIPKGISKKELLKLQSEIRSELKNNKDYSLMRALSSLAQAMKVQHALELLETQGITALKKYFDRFIEEAKNTRVKAVKNLLKDHDFTAAISKTNNLYEEGVEHPKLPELIRIIKDDINRKDDVKIIVFTQYRDSATKIVDKLKTEGVKVEIFVGQQKKQGTGLSQKEQRMILDRFRNNEFNVLVSTSVGEEGLDIPQVDRVIFYEPIPSAIRQIQRRGRTGRQEQGLVTVLYTKNTRDEAYMWAALHKEKRMRRTLQKLKTELVLKPNNNGLNKAVKNPTLTDFMRKNSIVIIADHREKNTLIFKKLLEKGVNLQLKKLEVGDYLLSDEVVVELKTKKDFVDSIIDGRLLEQIKALKEHYEKPILIIQGEEDIYGIRNIHKNSIDGMIITITLNYGIPILWTKNPLETTELLYLIARKEQEQKNNNFEPHNKKPLTLKEQQEYIVSSLPGIGLQTARELLRKFKSVKAIFNADEEELKQTELIGEKKAKKIREVIDSWYEE